MSAPATVDEFLDLVHKSSIVDAKRLDAYLKNPAAQLPASPNLLANVLVQDGLLTRFQADQLLQGKWRRFQIGNYKVLERLGSGGMGNVFLCEHKVMKHRVAIKVLATVHAEDPNTLKRFYREARAGAALEHPNIVRSHDIGQDETLHFLVMDYVDGTSLEEVVKKYGPLDVLHASHYIRQASCALEHAHEAGLVHRDIKPGNLLLERTGVTKVLDMGVARYYQEDDEVLTKGPLGTADYLSPEQARDSHGVDIRADIYSLGATFYFLLTGKPPYFEAKTVAQKLIFLQTKQPKPIRELRPDVPEGVATIIHKMLAKDSAQRYQTPLQVMDALGPWTQTPIAPPPEEWMPKLSLAALGGEAQTVSNIALTPINVNRPAVKAAVPAQMAVSPEADTMAGHPSNQLEPSSGINVGVVNGVGGSNVPGSSPQMSNPQLSNPMMPMPQQSTPKVIVLSVVATVAVMLLGAAVFYYLTK